MKNDVMIYQINEIPDPMYPKYQAAAGGSVLAAAGRDFEHLLRAVSNISPGSVSIAIRFAFTPNPSNGNKQSRLNIYLMARASDGSLAEITKLLIERGALSRFYDPLRIDNLQISYEKFQAVWAVIRREDAVDPLYKPEYNYKIPEFYYTIQPFIPNELNDYISLDRVLGDIQEQVIIDICIEPCDISKELASHTNYLSRLQSINRVWDREEEDDLINESYFGNNSILTSTGRKRLKLICKQDPLADNIFRKHQRFHETLHQPQLQFHINVFSESPAVGQLIGSVVADGAFKTGSYRLMAYHDHRELLKKTVRDLDEILVSTFPSHEQLFKGKNLSLYHDLKRLSQVATVDELTGAFRLPVASINSPRCIRMNTDPLYRNANDSILVGYDYQLPELPHINLLNQFPKGISISGTTGSGKTIAMFNMLFQLHRYDIPFLVIEPVKTEYRIPKTFNNHPDKIARSLAERLEIYTPGNEAMSKFRFNPLLRESGISVEEHIDSVLSCFYAAMPLEGPLPALLGEGLERVYEDYPDENYPPLITDLVESVHRVLDEKGYSPETKSDIKTALEVRLGVLTRRNIGRIFQCRYSYPDIDHLVSVPAVIELDRLAPEQVSLITFFLLTDIRQYFKTVSKPNGALRYAILIEEAHNIVGRTGNALASPDIANPKAFAADFICRMLVEVRGIGVAVIIVDQHPSQVAPQVTKSTVTKLAFRQNDKEDREITGSSMLFGQTEFEEIARLSPGEAFFFTEGYHRARKIQAINLHDRFDFSADVTNEKLLPYIQDNGWFKKFASERTISELNQLREQMDRFDEERIKILQELKALINEYLTKQIKPELRDDHLNECRQKALELRNRLCEIHQSFVRHSYRRYRPYEITSEHQDPMIEELRKDLVYRFECVIAPDVEKTIAVIDSFLKRCN